MAEQTEQTPEAPSEPSNAIDDLVSEFFTQPEVPQEAQAPEPEAVEAPVEVPAIPEQKEAAPEPALSPLLAAKAKSERELRAKLEEAKSSAEAAAEAARAEVIEQIRNNPGKFLADHSLDAETIALHAYAASLGDDAPIELKQKLGMSELEAYKSQVEAKFRELELQREQAAIQAQARATLDQYEGFLAVPNESLPYFTAEVSHDANGALRAMADLADHMAGENNGKYPSAVEVAQLIEEQLSSTAARYAAISKPSVETSQTVQKSQEKQAQSITLSNEQAGSSAKKLPEGEDELFAHALELLESMTAG